MNEAKTDPAAGGEITISLPDLTPIDREGIKSLDQPEPAAANVKQSTKANVSAAESLASSPAPAGPSLAPEADLPLRPEPATRLILQTERTLAPDGMFVAQSSGMKKTASNGEYLTQRDEQKFPVEEISAAQMTSPTPLRLRTRSRDVLGSDEMESSSIASSRLNWPSVSSGLRFEPDLNAADPLIKSQPPVGFDPLAMQISKQAIALKHFNAESMAVVLKPDDATAVFLHLKLSGGQVEVHARMERGDYSAMNSNWSQLQQALAPQGIRLGALQEAATNHSTSAAAFGSFARDREERPSQKSFVPEPGREQPLPTRTTKVTLRVAPKLTAAKKHWESWA